jgi:hypothetical protein
VIDSGRHGPEFDDVAVLITRMTTGAFHEDYEDHDTPGADSIAA